MCFLADGGLDPAFGIGGQVTMHFGATDRVNAVTLQPDGEILAAGSGAGNVTLVRYLADGTLDSSFGTSGRASEFSGSANALVLQPDGKVVVAGASAADFILARYTAVVPSANDDTFVLSQIGPNAGTGATSVLANDVSADGQGQNLVSTLDSDVAHGSLTLNPDGSFRYIPGATFQGIDRFTYHVSEGTANGNSATVTLLSYHASLVDKLYNQVLGRSPINTNDLSGLFFWTSQLDQGKPLDVVAQGIFNSPERLNPLVTSFYHQFLDRGTDPGGLAFWVKDWQTTGDPFDVAVNILGSPEFTLQAANAFPTQAANDAFVSLLYERVLGTTTPDTTGFNFWTGQLDKGLYTKQQVANAFESSPQNHIHLVEFLFSEYFKGDPQPPSPVPYENDLDNGKTQTQVELEIIDSTDYQNTPPEPAAGTVGVALFNP